MFIFSLDWFAWLEWVWVVVYANCLGLLDVLDSVGLAWAYCTVLFCFVSCRIVSYLVIIYHAHTQAQTLSYPMESYQTYQTPIILIRAPLSVYI